MFDLKFTGDNLVLEVAKELSVIEAEAHSGDRFSKNAKNFRIIFERLRLPTLTTSHLVLSPRISLRTALNSS